MNADAVSDLVLAIVCFIVSLKNLRARPGLAVASGMLGMAAVFGVLRFSGIAQLLGPHRFASLLAACAAFPLLAIAIRWPDDPLACRTTAAARFIFLAGAAGVALTMLGLESWRQLVPAASVTVIFIAVVLQRSPVGIAGASAFVASLLAAGQASTAIPGPLTSMQWMHYLMAAGLGLLAIDNTRSPAGLAEHGKAS